jgi:hypothetical protein
VNCEVESVFSQEAANSRLPNSELEADVTSTVIGSLNGAK